MSGLVLALVALLEAWLYTRDSGDPPTTIVLALGSTLPLMMRRGHLKLAATIVIVSTVLAIAGQTRRR